MKNFLFLSFVLINLFQSCGSDETEKLNQYEKKFQRINEITPDDLCLAFMKSIENSSPDSPFNSYTPEMISSQEATIYRIASEKNGELIIDILIYRKILAKKGLEFSELESIIQKHKKNDPFFKIVNKSLALMIEYEGEKLKREYNNY